MADHYDPATPLSGSKDYMHLKFAATEGIPKDVHFVLIESVAEHIIDTLFLQDDRIEAVEVKIVKQIGRAPSELQSLMRSSYAVFCLKKKKHKQQIHPQQ